MAGVAHASSREPGERAGQDEQAQAGLEGAADGGGGGVGVRISFLLER